MSRPLSMLHKAAKDGDIHLIQRFLEHDPYLVESRMDGGWTPLMLAARSGHMELVRNLCAVWHADVEARDMDGWSPVIFAAFYGRVETVRYLVLGAHANLEAQNNDGSTALSVASSLGYLEVVKVLVEEGGADVETQDADGVTASGRAELEGFEDIVKYLKVKEEERSNKVAGRDKFMSEAELLLLRMEELLDYQATLFDHQKLIAKVVAEKTHQSMTCVICMEGEKDVALIPCGHRYCSMCSIPLKTCPEKSAKSGQTIKAFFLNDIISPLP